AVGWFADEVFPAIRAALPDAQFLIVGARPAAAVQKLASRPGIVVTGRVESTAAYLAHATVAVAPLQIARGVQNKVLEAMAMACATVVSEGAMTGIAAESGTQCIAAASPGQWADACLTLVRDRDVARRMGDAARRLMIEAYNWEAQFAKLDRMIDTARSRPGQMGAGGNATAPTTGEATVQPMTARGRS
ncbi:MAG: glycosyltransferase, partial [Casimicrobiaceae bacterium]